MWIHNKHGELFDTKSNVNLSYLFLVSPLSSNISINIMRVKNLYFLHIVFLNLSKYPIRCRDRRYDKFSSYRRAGINDK